MTPPRPIVLTGMMGSGKTRVAAILAQRLERPIIDLDQEIERTEAASIAEIFARSGEAGFRELERAAVEALPLDAPAVIATGGGTLLDPENRARLAAKAHIVCLSASVEELTRRLVSDSQAKRRPLLTGDSASTTGLKAHHGDMSAAEGAEALAGRLTALWEARRSHYDSIPLQVDTVGRSAEAVAEQVMALVPATAELDIQAIPVRAPSPSGGYALLVGAGLLDALPTILKARGLLEPAAGAALIADANTDPLYGEALARSLERDGMRLARAMLPAGEDAKRMPELERLQGRFLEAGLGRDAAVLALGGGCVGDTAGFAAATYLRGVDWIPLPTTLLAMVDAAIGGKTGLNRPEGKNLVGAFHHPRLVVADTRTLATLAPRDLRAGLAEVVKAGLIARPALLDRLSEGAPAADDAQGWARIVAEAAAVKAEIVSADPGERGQRALLNLGHTFAHAIERETQHAYRHGEAVAIGLVAAARLSGRLGLAEAGLAERTEALLANLGLPTRLRRGECSAQGLMVAMAVDKKRLGGSLRFVLPCSEGDVRLFGAVDSDPVLATLTDLHAD